jgi:hypothetical protein
MPFDESLVKEVRRLISGDYTLSEKRMFGGLEFMVNGHLCCGVVGQDLVVSMCATPSSKRLSLGVHLSDLGTSYVQLRGENNTSCPVSDAR